MLVHDKFDKNLGMLLADITYDSSLPVPIGVIYQEEKQTYEDSMSAQIEDAKTKKDAKEIGKSIVNSPLFKTAMAGSDSNWGRVIMAIGKSHSSVDAEKLTLKFGKFFILKKGKNFSPKDLSNINKYLKEQEMKNCFFLYGCIILMQ